MSVDQKDPSAEIQSTEDYSRETPTIFRASYSPLSASVDQILSKLSMELNKAQRKTKTTLKYERACLAKRITRLKKRVKDSALKTSIRKLTQQKLFDSLELSQKYKALVSSANLECLELCLKVISHFIQDSPELLLAGLKKRISESISSRLPAGEVSILAHHSEAASLQQYLSNSKIECCIREDDGIPPGTARIKSCLGSVDINWKCDLEFIAGELRAELASKISNNIKISNALSLIS